MKNLTDDEKILIWLGYHSYERNDKTYYVHEDGDVYSNVICLDRERLFLTEVGDPELDLLVLMKVRTFDQLTMINFRDKLDTILRGSASQYSLLLIDLFIRNYQPGDYARAARFLWHKS